MIDLQIHERFVSLLEKNLGIILKISKAYTNTVQDREDLINDIAYEMWKSFPQFESRSKISTWIYRIALNTAMNYRRDSNKKKDFLKDSIEFLPDVPSDESDINPQIELLYDCISDLDEFNKAIILLYLDGYKHDEIADITGISKTNVSTRIARIKEQLKTNVNKKQVSYGT